MTDATIPLETRRAVEACQRELPDAFSGATLAFGFDGIVDNVRVMVAKRHSSTDFDRLATLEALRDRLDDSIRSESSLTVEWELEGRRTGGHACHLSRAFNKLGADTTMIGMYGQPPVDPFSSEFADSTLVSIGAPGYTEAVEFDDGKLLLTESSEAAGLDWETLCDRLDPARLAEQLDGTDVLGVGYWSVTSSLPELLRTLVSETWPLQSSPPEQVFFDPGDVRSLPLATIRDGAAHLRRANATVPVTVSANRSEIEQLATALNGDESGTLKQATTAAFDGLGVCRVVGHSPSKAVTVSDGTTISVRVPKTDSPAMTTSAGDHFNAGFLLGRLVGLSEAATTVIANAVAGLFVRTGTPPSYADIVRFVDGYFEAF